MFIFETMGCKKLTYITDYTPLAVVYNKQKTVQRLWNVDPVVKPWESPYATFSNNPIVFNDPNGLNAVPRPTFKVFKLPIFATAGKVLNAIKKGCQKIAEAAGRVNDAVDSDGGDRTMYSNGRTKRSENTSNGNNAGIPNTSNTPGYEGGAQTDYPLYASNGGVPDPTLNTDKIRAEAIRKARAKGANPDNANVENTTTATKMFLKWASGYYSVVPLSNPAYHINDAAANALRNAHGIMNAREKFYKSGGVMKEGRGDFGIEGLLNAGLDPIEQYIGSYNYSIKIVGDQLQFTIKNTTSFASFSYHLWPYKWNWDSGPMGDFTQIYIFTEPIRK